MEYVLTQQQQDSLQAFLPNRLLFSQENDYGLLVHDVESTALWDVDLNNIANQAGFSDYQALLDSFEPATNLHVKIARYLQPDSIDPFSPPMDQDYRITAPRLQKIMGERDSGGFVRRWDYAELEPDPATGQIIVKNIVVQEFHDYTIEGLIPTSRREEIRWILENGEFHPSTKVRVKYYNTPQAVAKEGEKRRGALLDEVIGTIGVWLQDTGRNFADGQAFTASLGDSPTLYVRDTNPQIIYDIAEASSSTFNWLDSSFNAEKTAREYMRDTANIYGIMFT